MTRLNSSYIPVLTKPQLAIVAGKASSFVLNYIISNNVVYYERTLIALEAIIFALLDDGAATAQARLDEIVKDEDSLKAIKNIAGFDGSSAFAEAVQQFAINIKSDPPEAISKTLRRDAAAMCVSLAYSLKIDGLDNHGYYVLHFYNRLLTYLSFRHSVQIYTRFGQVDSLFGKDVNAAVKEIKATEGDGLFPEPMTSFAFEDLTDVFMGEKEDNHVNAYKMKDCELQSYDLYADFVYSDLEWGNHPFCVDRTMPVKNQQGKVTGFKNIGPIDFPCIDEGYNIAPISGTILKRRTVEAPPVTGIYSEVAMDYIEKRLVANYPPGAFYGEDFYGQQEYKHSDGTYLSSHKLGGGASHYEAYAYVHDHETRRGNPWLTNENRYVTCNNYLGEALSWTHTAITCRADPLQCNLGNPATIELPECVEAGCSWATTVNGGCECSDYESCYHAGGAWNDNVVEAYLSNPEIIAPPAFPNFAGTLMAYDKDLGQTKDMSLRHHIINEEVGTSSYWWDDLSVIDRTGFALIPLEFSEKRLRSLYSGYKANPIIDLANIGRRAFAAETPTVGHAKWTVGPPQTFFGRYENLKNDWAGGPFAHAQIYVENFTKKQNASITITPGWMWKFQTDTTLPAWHTMETGGWNMPLSQKYYKSSFSNPIKGEVRIEFESSSISNNFNRVYITGNQVHPNIYNGGNYNYWDYIDPKLKAEGAHNQTLTPNRFFGMGDSSQDYEISGYERNNAGYKYTFYSVPTGKINADVLYGTNDDSQYATNGQRTLKDTLKISGAEGLYTETTLGVSGPDFWHKYITGYIYTGEDHAGEIVSVMHPWTGYSTTSNNTLSYWYVEPNTPEYFPYSGFDKMAMSSWYLAPTPNISRCLEHFPEGPAPPTTTTTTTTTEASNGGGGPGFTSSTTTTEPSLPEGYDCTNNPKTVTLDCYEECSDEFGDPVKEMSHEVCSYEMCIIAECDNYQSATAAALDCKSWDCGIFPEDRNWAPLYGKQRGENPARYWRGPFASTHFKFMYPHASGAFRDHWEDTFKEEDYAAKVTGFPWKVKFSVKIKEWIAKDICSGGYINSAGGINLTHRVRNGNGETQPEYQTKNASQPWPELIDSGYSPRHSRAFMGDQNYEQCLTPMFDSKFGRNNNRYSGVPHFCGGNKHGTGSFFKYDGTSMTAWNDGVLVEPGFGGGEFWAGPFFTFGGYHRYSGYDFDMVTTYTEPTYRIENYETDYSRLYEAIEVGNKGLYSCDVWPEDLLNLDPVYFLPMASDSRTTGIYLDNYPNCEKTIDPYGCPSVTGNIVHRHRIYGDHWLGARSGCLLRLTGTAPEEEESLFVGDCIGNEPPSAGYGEFGSESAYCLWAKEQLSEQSVGSGEIFLFNVSPSGIDVHFRHPAYVDGHNIDVSDCSFGYLGGEQYGMMGDSFSQCSDYSIPHTIRITGDDEGKKIELFKDQGDDNSVSMNFETEIVRREGLLYELPRDCSDRQWTNQKACEDAGETWELAEWQILEACERDYACSHTTHTTPEDCLAMTNGTCTNPAHNDDAVACYAEGTCTDPINEVTAFKNDEAGCTNDSYLNIWNSANNEWDSTLHTWGAIPSQHTNQGDCEAAGKTWGLLGDFENIFEFGARVAQGVPVQGTTTTFTSTTETPGSTTTTEGPDIPGEYVKVSGWREVSKMKVVLYDFEVYGLDRIPSDDQFRFQQSGDCMLTGYLEYNQQEEASIYSEGIVLEDRSPDPWFKYIDYPHYASEVLQRGGFTLPDDFNHPVEVAPSRMLTRYNITTIEGTTETGNFMLPIKSEGDYYYNRYLWPTISDVYKYAGRELSWESVPSDDGHIFPNSQLLISSEQGQPKDVGEYSKKINKQYLITQHWGIYDSLCVNPLQNWFDFVEALHPPVGSIGKRFYPAGGYVVPVGTTVWDIKRGYVSGEKQGVDAYTPED
jgi:hypothetical protein